MLRFVLLVALLTPQMRPPSALRAPATPPSGGHGPLPGAHLLV